MKVLIIKFGPEVYGVAQAFANALVERADSSLSTSTEDAQQLIKFWEPDLLIFTCPVNAELPKAIETIKLLRGNKSCTQPAVWVGNARGDTAIKILGAGIQSIVPTDQDTSSKAFSVNSTFLTTQANNLLVLSKGQATKDFHLGKFKLVYDPLEVFLFDEKIRFTKGEAKLFSALLQAKGKPLNDERLYSHMFDQEKNSDIATIKVHISYIRKKIESACHTKGYDGVGIIKNTYGQGYSIDLNKLATLDGILPPKQQSPSFAKAPPEQRIKFFSVVDLTEAIRTLKSPHTISEAIEQHLGKRWPDSEETKRIGFEALYDAAIPKELCLRIIDAEQHLPYFRFIKERQARAQELAAAWENGPDESFRTNAQALLSLLKDSPITQEHTTNHSPTTSNDLLESLDEYYQAQLEMCDPTIAEQDPAIAFYEYWEPEIAAEPPASSTQNQVSDIICRAQESAKKIKYLSHAMPQRIGESKYGILAVDKIQKEFDRMLGSEWRNGGGNTDEWPPERWQAMQAIYLGAPSSGLHYSHPMKILGISREDAYTIVQGLHEAEETRHQETLNSNGEPPGRDFDQHGWDILLHTAKFVPIL